MRRAKPKTRDADRTRARILDRADRLFSRNGFQGTSLSDIVGASGVNKRMVYHYFGDKEGLYRALFLKHWSDLKEVVDRALREWLEETPRKEGEDPLSTMLTLVFDFMAERQGFVRLLMWEGLEGGKVSRSLWKDIRGPFFAQTEFHLRQAQREGRLDARLDPAQLVVSFLGAITFYFGYANSLGDLLGVEDPLAPAELARYRGHLRGLVSALISG